MKNIILLLSKDNFLIKRKIKEILDDLNVDEEVAEDYNLDEETMSDLVSNLLTVSVFDEARVIICANPSIINNHSKENEIEVDASDIDLFNRFSLACPSDSYLIFTSNNYNKDNPLASTLRKCAQVYDLDKEEISLDGFFNEYVKKNNLNIDDKVKNIIMSRSSNYQELENNLIKLDCYSDGTEITKDMVDLLIEEPYDDKIYLLSSYIVTKNISRAYKMYKDLIANGVSSAIIYRSLVNRFTLLLYVSKMLRNGSSQDDISVRLNVKSTIIYYAIKDVRAIGEEQIVSYINKLEEININARNGMMDESLGLELLILEK